MSIDGKRGEILAGTLPLIDTTMDLIKALSSLANLTSLETLTSEDNPLGTRVKKQLRTAPPTSRPASSPNGERSSKFAYFWGQRSAPPPSPHRTRRHRTPQKKFFLCFRPNSGPTLPLRYHQRYPCNLAWPPIHLDKVYLIKVYST